MKSDRVNFFVRLAIIVIICFAIISIVKLQVQFNDLKAEAAELLLQKQRYEDQIDQIDSELEREFDDEYIMRIAMEKLNYYLPDDVIFFNNK